MKKENFKNRSKKLDKKFRWNLWFSEKERKCYFYKKGDRREKTLSPDFRIVKFFYSKSYNSVWPKCYGWIEENLNG